jgi:hypothetical protein
MGEKPAPLYWYPVERHMNGMVVAAQAAHPLPGVQVEIIPAYDADWQGPYPRRIAVVWQVNVRFTNSWPHVSFAGAVGGRGREPDVRNAKAAVLAYVAGMEPADLAKAAALEAEWTGVYAAYLRARA